MVQEQRLAAIKRGVYASVACRYTYSSTLISSLKMELLERPQATFKRTLYMMSAVPQAAFNQGGHT